MTAEKATTQKLFKEA